MMNTYLEKHNIEKNQHRFWTISVQPNLFGGWSVVRRWGRVGSRGGRQKIDLHDDLATAQRGFEKKEREKQYGDLLEHLQAKLKDSVKQVRLSNRLTTSPACLVGEEGDFSPQMERILRQHRSDSWTCKIV